MIVRRLPILLAMVASSQAFLTPFLSGRRPATLGLGKGILEMAEVGASTVFPPPAAKESFLGNYEDLVMPGKEGHGYQLILEDDDESFRLYVKQQQQSSALKADNQAAQQRARANIGYYLNQDLVGNVPETKGSASNHIHEMRQHMDFFSSHAVGTKIPDNKAVDNQAQRRLAREHMGFFSTPLAIHLPKDVVSSDATEVRARARANIDFFALKEHTGHANTMEDARKVARNNIDFFADKSASFPSEKKANDESKERTTARLNIGYFS